MDTFEITVCGHTFTVTDAKGKAHAQAAVIALEQRLAEMRRSTGVQDSLRVALMAALCAEAELLDMKGG